MSTHLNAWWHDLPLWKRGIEGDFLTPRKSPLAPLFQSGEYR